MTKLKHSLLAVAFAAAAFPAAAQTLVPAQSTIGFVSRQMGVPVEGQFKRWNGQVAFDPKKPEAAKVTLTIETGSASFGAPETDAEMPKAPWFNVAQFPQATFTSTSAKAAGPGKLEVAGKLTIKGQSQNVVVPVTLQQAGPITTASGTLSIKRLDFKIGEGEWADTSMVANDVQVRFKLALQGVPAL